MIKSLYIDNFKALNDFSINLKPLSVLIGRNACGKSTILQALHMLINLVQIDITTYLKNRKWYIEDLKSQFSNKRNITFKSIFEFIINESEIEVEWEVVFTPEKKKNLVSFRKERVVNKTTGNTILNVDAQGITIYNAENQEKKSMPALDLSASFIKNIDASEKIKYPELSILKTFLMNSDSIELLSPQKIARNSRGRSQTIGEEGENLSCFIHDLKFDQKEKINERLKKYFQSLSKLNTKIVNKWGWIEMIVYEEFLKNSVSVKAKHLSDGILRIIVLSALSELPKHMGVILLEEIENGINPHIIKILSEDLYKIVYENMRQIVLTTHSSVLLDFFSPESIILVWRDENGAVHSSDMFSNEDIKNSLEYMYPGEIWLNMDENEIINALQTNSSK